MGEVAGAPLKTPKTLKMNENKKIRIVIAKPGLDGHVRLNIATSPERLTEIVRRMASALVAG